MQGMSDSRENVNVWGGGRAGFRQAAYGHFGPRMAVSAKHLGHFGPCLDASSRLRVKWLLWSFLAITRRLKPTTLGSCGLQCSAASDLQPTPLLTKPLQEDPPHFSSALFAADNHQSRLHAFKHQPSPQHALPPVRPKMSRACCSDDLSDCGLFRQQCRYVTTRAVMDS